MKHTDITHIPATPGVYLMKDKAGIVIYVGKAINLKKRVAQYFSGHDKRYQIDFLMKRMSAVDYLQTNTEAEALLLENSLIKKHKPKYNVFLKDDKTYLGLKITTQDDFPRLLTTRKIRKDGATYFGPFTNSDSLRQIKEFIDKHFQLRTCADHDFITRKRPCLEHQIKRCSAPCVAYVSQQDYAKQIQDVLLFLTGRSQELKKLVKTRMHEAALRESFEEAARLRDLLSSMAVIFEGQNVTKLSFDFVDVIVFKRLEDRVGIGVLMVREASLIDSRYYVFKSLEDDHELLQNFILQYYTENSFIPGQILLSEELKEETLLEGLLSQRAGQRIQFNTPHRGHKKELLQLAHANLQTRLQKHREQEADQDFVLERLRRKLLLQHKPTHIECYDVSHISGQQAVASLVTFKDGKKFTDGYRRFKIKTVEGVNDYAMLKEVFLRRFRFTKGKRELPDLVLVDGGKGQLKQLVSVFEEFGIINVDVVAIAKGQGQGVRAKGNWQEKKQEEIYIRDRKNPLKLKPASKELMFLQQIRDEAHRFAIAYHRQLREKDLTHSWLDTVPGTGKKIKENLIKHFGSPQAVAQASLAELKQVKGVTEKIALHVLKYASEQK